MSKLITQFRNNKKLLIVMVLMAIIPNTINYGLFTYHFTGTDYTIIDCTKVDLSGFKGETPNDRMTMCEFHDSVIKALNVTVWGMWIVGISNSLLAVLLFFLYWFRDKRQKNGDVSQ